MRPLPIASKLRKPAGSTNPTRSGSARGVAVVCRWGLLAACAAAGCATPLSPGFLTRAARKGGPADAPAAQQAASRDDRGAAGELPDAVWRLVLADLQDLGQTNPAAQHQLIEELKTTEPVHYPLVIQQFRAALAYRERHEQRAEPASVASRSGRGPRNLPRETAAGRVDSGPGDHSEAFSEAFDEFSAADVAAPLHDGDDLPSAEYAAEDMSADELPRDARPIAEHRANVDAARDDRRPLADEADDPPLAERSSLREVFAEPPGRPLSEAAVVPDAYPLPRPLRESQGYDPAAEQRAAALSELQRLSVETATRGEALGGFPPATEAVAATARPAANRIAETASTRLAISEAASWVSDNRSLLGGSPTPSATHPDRSAGPQASPLAGSQLEAARRAFDAPTPRGEETVAAAETASLPAAQHAAPAAVEGDAWRQLDPIIDRLARSLPTEPRTVDELHEHLRLRHLLLVAGRTDEALETLPVAGMNEQAFWSKQLFAMATFLDAEAEHDQRQRASATLARLDEARDELAQIANLRIRGAAFVESVDGFGAYAPIADTRFRPGQQVAVYAEVENFRSESSPDGFRTVLATCYQVFDDAGRRVDGGEFPEVEDLCLNRRRDFHMQYAIPLPDRIYPGSYRLELAVTDRLSNKIGSQRIDFEIVE